MKNKLKLGDVIVFDPTTFNPEYWNKLSEKERKKYYAPLGYGKKNKFFVFLTNINDAPGHCIIISMEHNAKEKVITMAHTNNFRKVTEKEF